MFCRGGGSFCVALLHNLKYFIVSMFWAHMEPYKRDHRVWFVGGCYLVSYEASVVCAVVCSSLPPTSTKSNVGGVLSISHEGHVRG